jgi:hypothetical protein
MAFTDDHDTKRAAFIEAARPLMKFLCENYHPHVTVIVTPVDAELLEGTLCTGEIMDYVRD